MSTGCLMSCDLPELLYFEPISCLIAICQVLSSCGLACWAHCHVMVVSKQVFSELVTARWILELSLEYPGNLNIYIYSSPQGLELSNSTIEIIDSLSTYCSPFTCWTSLPGNQALLCGNVLEMLPAVKNAN